jgi:DNA-binding response OmpR family regulator
MSEPQTAWDQSLRRLTGRAGKVTLTPLENDALSVLLTHRDQLVSRDRMLVALHGRRHSVDRAPRSLDVLICRLRAQMTAAGAPWRVVTVYAAGWVLEDAA